MHFFDIRNVKWFYFDYNLIGKWLKIECNQINGHGDDTPHRLTPTWLIHKRNMTWLTTSYVLWLFLRSQIRQRHVQNGRAKEKKNLLWIENTFQTNAYEVLNTYRLRFSCDQDEWFYLIEYAATKHDFTVFVILWWLKNRTRKFVIQIQYT